MASNATYELVSCSFQVFIIHVMGLKHVHHVHHLINLFEFVETILVFFGLCNFKKKI